MKLPDLDIGWINTCKLHVATTAANESGCAACLCTAGRPWLPVSGDWPPPADKGFSHACPQPGPTFVMAKTEAHNNTIMYPDFTFLDWVVSQAQSVAAARTFTDLV